MDARHRYLLWSVRRRKYDVVNFIILATGDEPPNRRNGGFSEASIFHDLTRRSFFHSWWKKTSEEKLDPENSSARARVWTFGEVETHWHSNNKDSFSPERSRSSLEIFAFNRSNRDQLVLENAEIQLHCELQTCFERICILHFEDSWVLAERSDLKFKKCFFHWGASLIIPRSRVPCYMAGLTNLTF